jgi:hypothetical protein
MSINIDAGSILYQFALCVRKRVPAMNKIQFCLKKIAETTSMRIYATTKPKRDHISNVSSNLHEENSASNYLYPK